MKLIRNIFYLGVATLGGYLVYLCLFQVFENTEEPEPTKNKGWHYLGEKVSNQYEQ